MNSGNTIFAQLIHYLSHYDFQQCVERHNGEHKVQSFSCWDQFLCMAFAQLTYRESLRDIEACLCATHAKLYHMGFRSQVSRNTLANANAVRPWPLWADFERDAVRENALFSGTFAGDCQRTGRGPVQTTGFIRLTLGQ